MTTKDKQVWEGYIRGITPVADRKPRVTAKPLSPRALLRKKAETAVERREAAQAQPAPQPKTSPSELAETAHLPLERKREKALRQGSLDIDGKIDLHGLTQVEAFAALGDFMRKKVKAGKRHLLIVTGKGRDGEGVLRRNLSHWLGQLPEASHILAIRSAAPQHGGDGAFYVLLRKKNKT